MKKYCLFLTLIIFVLTGCGPVVSNSNDTNNNESHKYVEKYTNPDSSTFNMYQIPVDNKFGKVIDIEPDYHDGVITVKYMSDISGIETAIIYNMHENGYDIRYGYQIQTNNKGE